MKGPWERTIFPEYLYDPGLFFDEDGKVYVVHGQGTLYLTELNSDVKSVKGKPVKIWQGGFKNAHELGGGFGMEGSHMYRINGKYYITCPAGGTGGWQICLRSDNIYGPYEHKLIMNDWSSYPENGLHQGGMVQLKNGDWWFMIMQDRGPIGRVPCLVPVKWIDGWPMLGDEGKDLITYPKPATGKKSKIKSPATTDEFNASQLGLQWQWNHNPDNSLWSVSERKGYLRLKTGRIDTDFLSARNTLTQRTIGPVCSGTTSMDVSDMREGDFAGLALLQKKYGWIGVKYENGVKKIVMVSAQTDKPEEVESLPLNQNTVFLKAECDFTDKKDIADFYYSLDGKKWTKIGSQLKMAYTLPHFMGYRFGLFNYATKTPGGYVDFDYFRISDSK